MESILRGLNEAQRVAVSNDAGVLQVLAPPGSGKTKTLTSRVGYLIEHHGHQPQHIIVCTFTVKAATEMETRIAGFLGKEVASKLVLGTFHSIARRYITRYGTKLGLSDKFGIADTSDTTAILARIIKRLELSVLPAKARARISALKSQGMTAEQFSQSSRNSDQQEIAIVYSEYQEHLKISNLLDFDDLLLNCVHLLRLHPSCVADVTAILVDEFQDTNNIQYELMRLFAQHKQAITIVGDPDQSIYGWRNAEIRNLKKMRSHYPETCVVKLEENYRSSGAILLAAQEVIEQDKSRPSKRLVPTHSFGIRPVLRKLPNAKAEASWIVSEIKRTSTLTGGLLKFSDYAILLRSASLSRQIESALGKEGIPYRMVGGHKFFERLEVKLILDYLRVVSLPDHSDALARVLNVPSRKIGDVTIQSLLNESSRRMIPLWHLILGIAQGRLKLGKVLPNQAERGLSAFVNLVLTIRNKLADSCLDVTSLQDFLTLLIRKIGLKDYLKKLKPEEFDTRWANVEELFAQAADFSAFACRQLSQEFISGATVDSEDPNVRLDAVLQSFLANVTLSTDSLKEKSDANEEHQVTISTIHASKGLEFPVIFIAAAYDGCIPHSRAEDTDEERRLLYVAMTRAQAMLYLSNPTENSVGGRTILSPFLAHQHLEPLFDEHGPNFTCSTTNDLALTLGRPAVNPTEVEQALKSCFNLKDDQWPTDGSDKVIEHHKIWIRQEEGFKMPSLHLTGGAVHPFRPPSKIRQVSGQQPASLQMTESTIQTAEFTEKSTTLKTSFMSATTLMAMQEQQKGEGKENRHPSALTKSVSAATKKRKAEADTYSRSGQHTLNSFFVKRSC